MGEMAPVSRSMGIVDCSVVDEGLRRRLGTRFTRASDLLKAVGGMASFSTRLPSPTGDLEVNGLLTSQSPTGQWQWVPRGRRREGERHKQFHQHGGVGQPALMRTLVTASPTELSQR